MLGLRHQLGLSADHLRKLNMSIVLLILILAFAFCLKQLKLLKSYSQFPSVRADVKWLPTWIAGTYRKDFSATSFIFQTLNDELRRFQDEGMCVLWFIRPYVFIFNADFTKVFYSETAAINKGPSYFIVKDFFGNGLFASDEEVWKVHRKLLNPAFSLGVLKGKMQIFNENGFHLAEKFHAFVDVPTDKVLEILQQCSFNVMSESVLGIDINDVKWGSKVHKFMENVDKCAEFAVYRLAAFWLHWDFLLPFFPAGRNHLKTIQEIHKFTHEVIEEVKQSLHLSEKHEIRFDDEEVKESFAEILIKTHLQDPSFTIVNVRDQLINIMAGGFDTTSRALMWCFYALGRHPHEQQKAYDEIISVTPTGDVTYDDLGSLKYLECILKETLRLYPVVPLGSRELKRDVQCGKYTFPKGAEIVFSSFLLHRNPHVYPDPERFDPERFSDTSTISPWTFRAFSEGNRYCIGKKFAMMKMKVLLVHVLRRFKIVVLDELGENDLDYGIILKSNTHPRVLFTYHQT